MKKIISIFLLIFLIASCKSNKKKQVLVKSDIHKIAIQEVIQVAGYTYLRAKEEGKEKWFASPTFQVEIGKTYYYKKGMEMPNFESNELKRTFKTIYFIDKISDTPNLDKVVKTGIPATEDNVSDIATKPNIIKEDVKIVTSKGVTTIAELFKNTKKFDGKIIIVKGKVTKFSPEIMNKNWIHLQDGTESDGNFDLTVTSNAVFNVGDIITIKGKVSLNKDFGFGYFYKLILEDAVIVK